MIEILIVFGFSWYFAKWLIAQRPTRAFLAFSFIAVFIASVLVGFLTGAALALALEVPNSFGAAVVGAMRGGIFGLIIGGWSLVKTYRTLRSTA
jgi:hypothetical protein